MNWNSHNTCITCPLNADFFYQPDRASYFFHPRIFHHRQVIELFRVVDVPTDIPHSIPNRKDTFILEICCFCMRISWVDFASLLNAIHLTMLQVAGAKDPGSLSPRNRRQRYPKLICFAKKLTFILLQIWWVKIVSPLRRFKHPPIFLILNRVCHDEVTTGTRGTKRPLVLDVINSYCLPEPVIANHFGGHIVYEYWNFNYIFQVNCIWILPAREWLIDREMDAVEREKKRVRLMRSSLREDHWQLTSLIDFMGQNRNGMSIICKKSSLSPRIYVFLRRYGRQAVQDHSVIWKKGTRWNDRGTACLSSVLCSLHGGWGL